MADQAFLTALRTYVEENYLKIATEADFVDVFQAASPDVDIKAIFARYFEE